MRLLITMAAAAPLFAQTHWVGTWGAAPSPQLPVAEMESQKLVFHHQTLREIVHISIGGDSVRVRLSNTFGTEPVEIGAAHVAVISSGSAIDPATDHALAFGGRGRIEIPAGAVVLSDPVRLKVAPAANLAISLYLPKDAVGGGVHYSAQQTNYIAQGDTTAAVSLDHPATITSWVFLTGVDVQAPAAAGSIIAFGDSITDGARSTVDSNHRWPDTLAARLLARKSGVQLGVVDMGIGGNRILHEGAASKRLQFGINALARFDQDVLAQPGVRYLMILEGINDIGHAGSSAPASEAVSAEDIIAGLSQMIERAHERGIKVIGATITPFEGEGNTQRGYWTPEKAKVREAVNAWIRSGKGFDGFVDFDKAVRDPANPNKILPAFDSGDQLHPGDAGYKAMGEAISLSLFGLR
ncbi:MAG TPA: SGNH/GDSL hydrolase family protein [Bryobacteraceae bacterium]|jgi:lysophospholipase L1-like esterase|nr:SGNH/GDSL hydrolase family protein [Bryobacteraceae bacterium]